jgi:hypothetical protein
MILAVAANAVSAVSFAMLAGLCAYFMGFRRHLVFPLLFLLISAAVIVAVSVSNILERAAHFTLVDRFEEYQECLILPFMLLFAYSWSAVSHLRLNEEYVALLHHRVKNDLQIVDSLFELEAGAEEPDARAALQSARARVAVISLAEQMSLEGGIPAPIDMAAFLSAIASRVAPDGGTGGNAIEVEADIRLEPYFAIPCGLLVAEAELVFYATGAALSLPLPRTRLATLGKGRYRLSSAVSLPAGFSSELADVLIYQLNGRRVEGQGTVIDFSVGATEGPL